METNSKNTVKRIGPLSAAGLTLGMGMGVFFDGIVFQQILQTHNMLSARIPTDTLLGAKVNMVEDGAFHAGVSGQTLVGTLMLWRAARRADTLLSTPALVGAILIGWGTFNLVEGVVDHHVLHLHHVYGLLGELDWDRALVAWGAVTPVSGWAMVKRAASAPR